MCHVLDKFTLPHVKEAGTDIDDTTTTCGENAEKLRFNSGPNCRGNVDTDNNGSSIVMAISSALTLSEREQDSYTSFNIKDGSDGEAEDGGSGIKRPSNDSELENLSPEDLLYSEFTDQMDNLYHGAGDDPLLLDCVNFIHFELDKDKVVVFDIASAYVKNNEILQQYAITLPRSSNLPEQKY